MSAQEREALVRLVWDDETTYAEAADLADKIIAAGWSRPVGDMLRHQPGRSEAEIKAEALREFADTRGVDVGDEDDDWWRGYRQAQRECLQDALDRAARLAGTTEAGDES